MCASFLGMVGGTFGADTVHVHVTYCITVVLYFTVVHSPISFAQPKWDTVSNS